LGTGSREYGGWVHIGRAACGVRDFRWEQEAADMTGEKPSIEDRIIYQSKKKNRSIILIGLGIVLLLFGSFLIGYILWDIDLNLSFEGFTWLLITLGALVIALILVYSVIRENMPKYRFIIYENGFIYPFPLKGTDKTTNYLSFRSITKIAFTEYGLICLVKTNTNEQNKIDFFVDEKGYLVLSKLLCLKIKNTKCPDFDIIEKMYGLFYRDANEEVSERLDRIQKEGLTDMDMLRNDLVDINKEFKEIPSEFQ
jgi:hypothetical protein